MFKMSSITFDTILSIPLEPELRDTISLMTPLKLVRSYFCIKK